MRAVNVILLISLAHASDETGADDGDDGGDGDVVVGTRSNFRELTESSKPVLVEFYAPWCGHCKQLAPAYKAAARILKDDGIALVKVDATDEENGGRELSSTHGVTGYPTLKVFTNGTAYDLDVKRDADGIVNAMRSWKPPEDLVIKLTGQNWDEYVPHTKLMLVEFYAPWCGHCKKLEPEFRRAANDLAKETPPIVLAAIDATEEQNKGLATKYEVNGYPTLKVFREGRPFEYTGGREYRTIVEHMRKLTAPVAIVLASQKDAQGFVGYPKAAGIVLFSEDVEMQMKFEEAAERHRDDYRYAVVQDRKIQAHLTNVQGDCVLLFQPSRFQSKYEEKTGVLRLSSSTAAADIAAFVDTSIVPLVGQLSAATEKTVYAHRPLVVAYFNVNFHPDYWKATQQMRSILLDVANENRDVRFAIASDSERESDVGMYDLQETISEYDVGVVLLGPGDAKYPLRNTKLSAKTLRAHLAAFKEGKLEQYLKSQKPPKKNDGDVKVVVGRTFNKYVLDKTKHVMIEFYAPWCGHCKALEPKYEEAAKILKKRFANVTLAKLDATANDIPYPFEAKAYPTLYWVPSGNASKAEVYQGGREADDLVKFVEAITITTTGSDSAGNAEL